MLGTKTGRRLVSPFSSRLPNLDGRFPYRPEDVAGSIVAHFISQTNRRVAGSYFEGEWSERTQRYQRTHIRKHCRFRVFRAKDESALT